MSVQDFSTSRFNINAQTTRPHSPPETPSPSSPLDITTKLPTSHSSSTIMSDPIALTPDGTPSDYSYHHTRDGIYQNGQPQQHGNGGFTDDKIPRDIDHSTIDNGYSHGQTHTSESMAPSWSNDTARLNHQHQHQHGKDYGSLNPARPRSPAAPLPNSFTSSSSVTYPLPGSEQRERVISPTRPAFLDVSATSQLPTSADPPPSYSSAGYDPSVYQPDFKLTQQTRSRSPYPGWSPQEGHHTFHPLSMPNKEAVNVPTEAYGGKLKEKFTDSAGYWLGMYFFFNLGLTLFNKVVLVSFPFPYTLTGLHALSGCAGCYFALERGAFTPARLNQKENLILAAFSVLYTINIAVSNISLQLVTVPFHQVVRASTPLFTILISTVLLRTRFSARKLVSLLPVVAGVGFATYGDYYFTAWGLILTLLGTFLAALKTVVTNLIQTGGGGRLKLHPLDLLMRMSPLAFIQCVAYGWYTGELERVRRYGATQMSRGKAVALLINGIIACGLNIVSFTANKKAGALTMTVSANCKQVMTIALAVVLFDLHINFTNGIGILLTLIGGGWYGYVEYTEKKKKTVKASDRG